MLRRFDGVSLDDGGVRVTYWPLYALRTYRFVPFRILNELLRLLLAQVNPVQLLILLV